MLNDFFLQSNAICGACVRQPMNPALNWRSPPLMVIKFRWIMCECVAKPQQGDSPTTLVIMSTSNTFHRSARLNVSISHAFISRFQLASSPCHHVKQQHVAQRPRNVPKGRRQMSSPCSIRLKSPSLRWEVLLLCTGQFREWWVSCLSTGSV